MAGNRLKLYFLAFCLSFCLILGAENAEFDLLDEVKDIARCECDSVMRPLFWFDFLPSYLKCDAELVCLLNRVGWISLQGRINAAGVAETFKRANQNWYDFLKIVFQRKIEFTKINILLLIVQK